MKINKRFVNESVKRFSKLNELIVITFAVLWGNIFGMFQGLRQYANKLYFTFFMVLGRN